MAKHRVVKRVRGKGGKTVSRAYWVNNETKRLAKRKSNRVVEALFGTSRLPRETRMQLAQMQYHNRNIPWYRRSF